MDRISTIEQSQSTARSVMATLDSVNASDHQAELVTQASLCWVTDNPSQEWETVSPSPVDTLSQDWETIYMGPHHPNSNEAAKNASPSPDVSIVPSWTKTCFLQHCSRMLAQHCVAKSTEVGLHRFVQGIYASRSMCTRSTELPNLESTPGSMNLTAPSPSKSLHL